MFWDSWFRPIPDELPTRDLGREACWVLNAGIERAEQPLPSDVVIGAGFMPGFAVDLTSWRIFLTESGCVRTDVRRHWTDPPVQREVSQCDPGEVSLILRTAAREGFPEMPVLVGSDIDDAAMIAVAIRNPDGVKLSHATADCWPGEEATPETEALRRIWFAIQRTSPWARSRLTRRSRSSELKT